jgi:hypothetical protein
MFHVKKKAEGVAAVVVKGRPCSFRYIFIDPDFTVGRYDYPPCMYRNENVPFFSSLHLSTTKEKKKKGNEKTHDFLKFLVLERNKPAGDALVNLLARLGTHFY